MVELHTTYAEVKLNTVQAESFLEIPLDNR